MKVINKAKMIMFDDLNCPVLPTERMSDRAHLIVAISSAIDRNNHVDRAEDLSPFQRCQETMQGLRSGICGNDNGWSRHEILGGFGSVFEAARLVP